MDLGGFTRQDTAELPEIRATGQLLRHRASGARWMHVHAPEDSENLWSVTVPTPPWDDAGEAHILEHCAVTGGSLRYPLRQPIFELIKMSMGTHINAHTAPDYTCYPVASTVRQDLWGLADVYFDSVFHPLLGDDTFAREGHRLTPGEPLGIAGIVYNEMKGAYSDPDRRLSWEASRALLPDTVYARSSGGHPEAIPDLSAAALRRFHRTLYHPALCYFFTYGDIEARQHAEFLEARLQPWSALPPAEAPGRQPRWSAPRRHDGAYPVGASEPLQERTFLLLQWLWGTASDPDESVLLDVCGRVLLGNEAAPLRRALIDSRLGQDLTHSGLRAAGHDAVFAVGLRGSEPDRAERFVEVVGQTLSRLAAGVDPDDVEAALRQAAYDRREIPSGFPLRLMGRAVQGWRLGADPWAALRPGRALDALRERWRGDPDLFARTVRERLADNPHRLLTVLRPDPEGSARAEAAFAARMSRVRADLGEEGVRRVALASAEVERLAGTPNPPEAVATVPRLRRADLPAHPRHIPTAIEPLGSRVTLLRNDVATGGVNYLAIDFDLSALPAADWPYAVRFAEGVRKFGAAGRGFAETARRVAATTGGCAASASVGRAVTGAPLRSMTFWCRALDEQVPEALALAADLLLALDPHDGDRLAAVLAQARAGMRRALGQGDPYTPQRYAARHLGPEGRLEEMLHGVGQLRLLEGLRPDDALMERIERIRDAVRATPRVVASFTGSDAAAATVREWLARWPAAGPASAAGGDPPPSGGPRREGLAAPLQVAWSAQVLPAPAYADPDSASCAVGAVLLTDDYVRPEVRFKGTAYGGRCAYDPEAATLSLLSWRDPHVTRTLGVFERARDYVAGAGWSQDDVDRAIAATLKGFVAPIRPQAATFAALERHEAGIGREVREARHQAVLAATPASVGRALLGVLDGRWDQSAACVLAGRPMLEAANRELGAGALALTDLLAAG